MERLITNPMETDYWLRKQADIVRTLTRLEKNKCLLTACLDSDRSSFITTIIGIDVKHNLLFTDYGPKDYLNAQILAEGKVVFRAVFCGIRTEFSARDVTSTSFAGQKVFACPLPEKLLWLERRRYYRVKAPLEHPPRCLIRIENETSEFSILDISMSGLAVITENTGFESRIDTGLILDDCKIVFPEYGEGIATLEIRNKTPGHKISLKDHVRFGCAFRQVLPAFESTIQRYMQMIERKRKNAP